MTATTSASEWILYLYWAYFRVLAPGADPRKPPFVGTPDGQMVYQSAYGGGRHVPGGSVADYVILDPTPIIVRLQTYRYHTAADAHKQAYDAMQLFVLGDTGTVVDVYEQDIIGDETGQAAILAAKASLGKLSAQNPITAGTVQQVRPF